ncbi:hypothetical protein Tco_1002651 [Tanacetum coccineum]|uniref:Uncharacterized protein n=1 Tax=Tanacetum coccineum TaxID=301880 RepID=A0ABQ5F8B5_9ASTR
MDEDKEGKSRLIITLSWMNWHPPLISQPVNMTYWYLRGTVNRDLVSEGFFDALTHLQMRSCWCQDSRSSSSLVEAYRHQISLYQEHVENGVVELYFVNTEYQLAGIFTKALARERIEFLINKLGMRSFTPETLKHLADEVDE